MYRKSKATFLQFLHYAAASLTKITTPPYFPVIAALGIRIGNEAGINIYSGDTDCCNRNYANLYGLDVCAFGNA